jgi:hypothetical protein
VISPRAVASKGHNSDLLISPTSPTRTHAHQLLNICKSEGFKDQKQLVLHTVLLASGTHCARWHKWAHLCQRAQCVWCKEHPVENILLAIFFMHLSKRETRLLISPTSLTEHRRSHVKKCHTNICFAQHHGESSPHHPGYHSLAGWLHITIEPDAHREYSKLVRLVSPRFIF